jgi:hypothetical protein
MRLNYTDAAVKRVAAFVVSTKTKMDEAKKAKLTLDAAAVSVPPLSAARGKNPAKPSLKASIERKLAERLHESKEAAEALYIATSDPFFAK